MEVVDNTGVVVVSVLIKNDSVFFEILFLIRWHEFLAVKWNIHGSNVENAIGLFINGCTDNRKLFAKNNDTDFRHRLQLVVFSRYRPKFLFLDTTRIYLEENNKSHRKNAVITNIRHFTFEICLIGRLG